MKNIFITLSIAAVLFAACTGKREHDHNDGTHEHSDGSTYQNHETDTVKQEEFTAPIDTIKIETEHNHEHPHKH